MPVLSPAQARAVYDRVGASQDRQGWYEDAAVDQAVAHGAFETARAVVEVGCGTGRLAARLLDRLPPDGTLAASDPSPVMADLARQRLAAWGGRARVAQAFGVPAVAPGSADRVVATYVLDLLSDADARQVIADAHRALEPGGRLVLAGLSAGTGPLELRRRRRLADGVEPAPDSRRRLPARRGRAAARRPPVGDGPPRPRDAVGRSIRSARRRPATGRGLTPARYPVLRPPRPDVLRLLLLAALSTTAVAQPAFSDYVPANAPTETLAEGFGWSEGPVWRPATGDLLFSDVPRNTVWRWVEGEGTSVFLRPSGLAVDDGHQGEAGSNGLALDAQGRLLIVDHGSRTVSRLDSAGFVRQTLAARVGGRRFNSPNDLAVHSSGALFFTDPPYGLAGQDDSPQKELGFNGVYRLDPDGAVTLLDSTLTRPNGVALSPDERTLYVANSDPARAVWMAYSVGADLFVGPGRVLFDATDRVGPANPGLPDGMAIGEDGTLFATGPGGVLVLTPEGQLLGTIRSDRAVANVAFGDDGRSLYLTATDTLRRIRLTTRGVGFADTE